MKIELAVSHAESLLRHLQALRDGKDSSGFEFPDTPNHRKAALTFVQLIEHELEKQRKR